MKKIMAELSNHVERTFALLKILQEETDRDHILSMPELIARLEEAGIHAERKAVYKSITALRAAEFQVVFVRRQRIQGYYLARIFSPSEILVLEDLLAQAVSISPKESVRMISTLHSLLSRHEAAELPAPSMNEGKTNNTEVLSSLQIAVHAIARRHYIDFRYYDLTVSKAKKYRKNNRVYHLLPVAAVSSMNRFYIVFYSPKYQSFANYRLDKMSAVTESEETEEEEIHFDSEAWIRSSFQMYSGDPATITLECRLSLIPQIYDQFGTGVIISSVSKETLTVSIRSAITPTLVAWILTFYEDIKVKKPQELIERLRGISDDIRSKYPLK